MCLPRGAPALPALGQEFQSGHNTRPQGAAEGMAAAPASPSGSGQVYVYRSALRGPTVRSMLLHVRIECAAASARRGPKLLQQPVACLQPVLSAVICSRR